MLTSVIIHLYLGFEPLVTLEHLAADETNTFYDCKRKLFQTNLKKEIANSY